jgi:hypothetical protein
MKKSVLAFTMVVLLFGELATAQMLGAKGLNFVAPTVDGKANIFDPQAGEIIYDHTDGHFYGYDITSPGWVDMSGGSASGGASSSYEISNLGLAASASSNILTISLKQQNGSDPSTGTSAVVIGFRNSTATTGLYSQRSVTGPLSIAISAGSTLGTVSGVTSYLYVYAIDNSGSIELALSSSVFDDGSLVTTTAEGGSGGADSINAIYSSTARSNVPARLIGRLRVNETTAGNWVSNASEISLIPFRRAKSHLLAPRMKELKG